jgi:RNA polymerase sigma-70 factor (ECF subfamily)
MPDDTAFALLIQRVRAGDQEAAAELVRRFEPAIRRAVRFRLVDDRLRRQFDSMDVCQSVLGSFFVRAAMGQFELEKSEQLLKLLATMVRHKVAERAKHEKASRRDYRRASGLDEGAEIVDSEPTASRQLEARELLDRAKQLLTLEERQILELRSSGLDWHEVAAGLGGTAEGVRKKLTRGVERVTRELGLEEVNDE